MYFVLLCGSSSREIAPGRFDCHLFTSTPRYLIPFGQVNPLHDVNRPFLVARSRMIRATDGYTKLVWFKQGFKGAVAKVSRAFNSSLIRPSEQPGAGIFDLLQVTEVILEGINNEDCQVL